MKIFSYELFSIEGKRYFRFPRLVLRIGLLFIFMCSCSCGSNSSGGDFDRSTYQTAMSEVISLSSTHVCAITDKSDLFCWGNDSFGQVTASGEQGENQPHPVQVMAGEKFQFVGTTGHATFAIKTDGTLWSWGDDYFGQRGIGLAVNAQIDEGVRQIGSESDWLIVRGAGDNHGACAIKEDGTLWCWGDNRSGQLGIGSLSEYETGPRQVGIDSDWIDVSLSVSSTCAVKTDQTLWCWGNSPALDSAIGADGMFTGAISKEPVRALNDERVRSMDLGGGNGCALTTEGDLYCWGTNDGGQLLGNEIHTEFHGPRRIASNPDWKQVTAGSSICVLRLEGGVECWGANNGGCLGRGQSQSELRYSQDIATVISDDEFDDLVGSTFSYVGRTTQGELRSWGRDTYGKMGNGQTGDQSLPGTINID